MFSNSVIIKSSCIKRLIAKTMTLFWQSFMIIETLLGEDMADPKGLYVLLPPVLAVEESREVWIVENIF